MSKSSGSQSYKSSQKLGAEASQTEARALLETARMMAGAQADMSDADAYRAALRLNWRLWTIIQADVSAPANPPPSDIKQHTLRLRAFIEQPPFGPHIGRKSSRERGRRDGSTTVGD